MVIIRTVYKLQKNARKPQCRLSAGGRTFLVTSLVTFLFASFLFFFSVLFIFSTSLLYMLLFNYIFKAGWFICVIVAIVKIASSGKSVLFIDDDGNVFNVGYDFLVRLLADKNPKRFCLLTRLAIPAAVRYLRKSPVFDPGLGAAVSSGDAIDSRSVRDRFEENTFSDKQVW